jgi:hypothetical protein
MTITESRVVLVRSERVVARFDGADGFRNFQASVKWAKARGYGPGDVICGPGATRDVGAELVTVTQVKA